MNKARVMALIGFAVLCPGFSFAQVPGNPTSEERGDIAFRRLKVYPWDDHPAIFNYWLDSQTTGPADLTNAKKQVIEMTGFVSTAYSSACWTVFPYLPYIVVSTRGITEISLSSFATDSPVYFGSYTNRVGTIPRGANGQYGTRSGIVQTAQSLLLRSSLIAYAADPTQCMGLAAFRYMRANGTDSMVAVDDVTLMRSDAFAEYSYAANGWWNLIKDGAPLSVATRSDMEYADNHAFHYSPRTLRGTLIDPDIDLPEITFLDGTNPIENGASSSTAINVKVDDPQSGPLRLELYRDGSFRAAKNLGIMQQEVATYTFGSSDIAELGSLIDARYSIVAVDQAGNRAVAADLIIKTSGAATDNKNAAGETLPNVFASTYCPSGHAVDSSGIASITLSSTGFSDITPFDCTPAKISTDAVGHGRCDLPSGSYTTTSVNCAGVSSSTTSTITSGSNLGRTCIGSQCSNFTPTAGSSTTIIINTAGACGGCSLDFFCASVSLQPRTSCHTSGGGLPYIAEYTGPCQKGFDFSIVNTTDTRWPTALQATGSGFLNDVGSPLVGETLHGSITKPEVNSICPEVNASTSAIVRSSYWALRPTQTSLVGALLSAIIRQVLAYFPGSANGVFGSDVVLTSSGTLTISLPNPSSIVVSTQTLAIFRFDGIDWSSAAVTNQSVSKDPTTSVISATGSIITSGYYALLFQANDSSAPITTLSYQGSSYAFDGTLFISTDAYVVLTATDPVVNGYASTVASVTYRMDPSSGSPFYIYSSSIPLPLGTHVFEYRSLDYAGNTEAVKTATFTVTAGTAFRTTNTAQVPGTLLNGFLGSGAKLEVESQAQNSLTLLISSVNRQGMVSVDNIGEVGIGVTPQANLNIGAGAIGLQLRSGNSTSSVTSNQIAFGFNGDYSMRHLLRTEHSTSTDGNKVDFLVWNTGATSTTTVASLNVLSLQGIKAASGGSFHVQPVGEPDAEVEVSNGLSTGGGTMQRLQVVAPSSRRFKTDIKNLSEKDENQALSDVAGLKHAKFRYKTRKKEGHLIEDPAQPLRTGLIYEEAPESIRDGAESLSTTERLVNVEMALKASMRRLEELQARYEKLKARRKP